MAPSWVVALAGTLARGYCYRWVVPGKHFAIKPGVVPPNPAVLGRLPFIARDACLFLSQLAKAAIELGYLVACDKLRPGPGYIKLIEDVLSYLLW